LNRFDEKHNVIIQTKSKLRCEKEEIGVKYEMGMQSMGALTRVDGLS